jgi:hypothetical protein
MSCLSSATDIEIFIDETVEQFEISEGEFCQNMASIFVARGKNKFGEDGVAVINALADSTEGTI